jgi:hypothetical protein
MNEKWWKNSREYENWKYIGKHYDEILSNKTSSSSEMLSDVLSRTEDVGFVEDIVSWLQGCAPRKIYGFLKELTFPMSGGFVSYELLCERVYELGFHELGLRANEIIERRMVFGPSNKWVKLYFEEFPLGS